MSRFRLQGEDGKCLLTRCRFEVTRQVCRIRNCDKVPKESGTRAGSLRRWGDDEVRQVCIDDRQSLRQMGARGSPSRNARTVEPRIVLLVLLQHPFQHSNKLV